MFQKAYVYNTFLYRDVDSPSVVSATYFSVHSIYWEGDRGGTVVKVLRYKWEGRWFDSRWCHWNFSLT